MKRIVPIVFVLLLNACTAQFNLPSQAVGSAVECPKPTVVPVAVPTTEEDFYQRFDYHIRNILADSNTIKFQTLQYDFVFCRANKTWTVQPGTISSELLPPKNYAEFAKELINPPYKNIQFQGKTYQYRVVIEPKFALGKNDVLERPNVAPENDKIVFELIISDQKEPERQTLYTLKDLQQQAVKRGFYNIGVQLGYPRITSTVIHENRLWWSVAFEQGEGNTGIATIVSYDPQADTFTVIQPEELWSQQITGLAITGDGDRPTFWIGTNISGEGNAYIPANGLVAYRPRPDPQNPNSGSLTSYTVHNSPLVGAIPDKLRLEDDTLWVGTGNGICQVKWQAADHPESWSCWRFAAMSKLPLEEMPLYSGLTNKTPAVTLFPSSNGEIEVLWWSPLDFQRRKGRYEVRYLQGFTVKLDQGARLEESRRLPPGKPPVYWPGFEWHWNGDRFVRGFDEVAQNMFGGGPTGIGSNPFEPNTPPNWNAIRGDLELLNLSPKTTSVRYYSGWVDENLLSPYLAVLPQKRPQNPQFNPLEAIANQLQP